MADPAWISSGDWLALTGRLATAVLAGGSIGWNRHHSGKPAGLRTHMLVSLGAALFVLIPLAISPSAQLDAASRAIQGVATGVGFLGAGEIIQRAQQPSNKPRIQGLTSAAAIWVTAALGMTAGAGLWQVSLIGTLMTLLILAGVKQLEQRMPVYRNDDDE